MSLPPGTDDLIRSALAEDLGSVGDITTRATVAADAIGLAKVEAREAGTVSGLRLMERVFRLVDPELSVQGLANDGDRVGADTSLAEVRGTGRSILGAERTALGKADEVVLLLVEVEAGPVVLRIGTSPGSGSTTRA